MYSYYGYLKLLTNKLMCSKLKQTYFYGFLSNVFVRRKGACIKRGILFFFFLILYWELWRGLHKHYIPQSPTAHTGHTINIRPMFKMSNIITGHSIVTVTKSVFQLHYKFVKIIIHKWFQIWIKYSARAVCFRFLKKPSVPSVVNSVNWLYDSSHDTFLILFFFILY